MASRVAFGSALTGPAERPPKRLGCKDPANRDCFLRADNYPDNQGSRSHLSQMRVLFDHTDLTCNLHWKENLQLRMWKQDRTSNQFEPKQVDGETLHLQIDAVLARRFKIFSNNNNLQTS